MNIFRCLIFRAVLRVYFLRVIVVEAELRSEIRYARYGEPCMCMTFPALPRILG